MTDKQDDGLSQWFDDEGTELEKRRAIKRACESDEEKAKFSRYQLIRDALNNQMPEATSVDFAAGVAEVIAHEQNSSAGGTMARAAPGWIRPFAGIAIAATVAAVAIMTTQPASYDPQSVSSGLPVMASNDIGPAQNLVRSVAVGSPQVAPRYKVSSVVPQGEMMSFVGPDVDRQWDQLNPDIRAALGRYILDHHSGQYQQPIPSVLPSVRVVGFNEVE